LDLCNTNEKKKSNDYRDYRDTIVSKRSENEKPAFSNSSDLKTVFEKFRCGDGLVWTLGLTVEIKLRLQISLLYCGRCLKETLLCVHIHVLFAFGYSIPLHIKISEEISA